MHQDARTRLLLVALLLGCGGMLPSTALAAPGRSTERVVLEIGSCGRAAADEIRRIVGIEIGDLLVPIGEATPAVANRLQIRCSGDTGMLGVTSQADSRTLDRQVLLDDFPHDAVPRVLALAGIETLAALSPAVRKRLSAQRSPEISVGPAVLPTEPTPPDRSREKSALRGRLAGMARAFSVAHGALSWGGRIDAEQELDRSWQLAFGVDLAGTRASTASLGQARAVLYSGCAFLGLHTSNPSVGASFNVGIRMGGVHLSGDADGRTNVDARSVSRVWGGPAAAADAFVAVGAARIVLAAEVGRSLFTSEGLADDATILSVGGNWLALSLGLVFRLW